MQSVPVEWGSYFANVNDKLASIALNLGLRSVAPMPDRPQLLWVFVYFRTPRPDGLSDESEFPTLLAIEDQLVKHIGATCNAVEVGRITSDGHREFYFYGANDKGFKAAVSEGMAGFKQYQFELGSQDDQAWSQYFNVLYPSDEDFQKMKNRDVLEVLREHGDELSAVRDVHHWIYFRSRDSRQWFAAKARAWGYSIEHESEDAGKEHPFGLHITRDQSVTPDQIDKAVVELFRLAKQVDADYDGWEAQVISIN
jgi:uncharacterized protein (TIGR01619 family)